MKKNLVLLAFICFSYSLIYSQVSDKKSVKKELKYYKKNVNEYLYKNSECIRKDSVIMDQEILIENLTSQLNALNKKLLVCAEKKEDDIIDTRVMPKGTSFQIQIGVYKNTELSQYLAEPKYVGFELDNQLIRYHLGYFRDYLEAKKFLEIVRRMGIKDAFITEYLDGQRVNYTKIDYNSPINKAYSSNKELDNTDIPKATSSNNKVKLQENWNINKEADGTEKINVNTSKIPTKKVNQDEVINEKTTTKKEVDITKEESTSTDDESATEDKSKEVNKTTTTTDKNAPVKLEKNWQMTEDEDGNQIIRIIPK
ncbi:MAG: hypothetical protein WCP57_09300 [Bacteroidota bacterium]